jgi:hypothetical protein
MRPHIRILVCGIMLLVMSFACMSTALAAPSLQWHTDGVYFDHQGRLVIEGYFYNNGDNTVTWVNWHRVHVYFKQHNTNWWHHTSATFNDLNVYLYPGDSVRWTFRIHNVDYAYFDFWRVNTNTNYNYNR